MQISVLGQTVDASILGPVAVIVAAALGLLGTLGAASIAAVAATRGRATSSRVEDKLDAVTARQDGLDERMDAVEAVPVVHQHLTAVRLAGSRRTPEPGGAPA